MSNDIESDFWKEIFRHLQHRNMSRVGGSRLPFAEAPAEIEKFAASHTDVNFMVDNSGSYITFEAPVTDTINLRLFIQNQIKASLMQKNGADWVKIADAKFFNNPFPEVELLLQNRDQYKKDLAAQKKETVQNDVKLRITSELIKAMMMKKWGATEGLNIHLEDNNFTVTATVNGQKKEALLSKQSFYNEIKLLN